MSSLYQDSGTGRWVIQFDAADGVRRSIRLGKMARRMVEGVRLRVDDLVAASITGQPAPRDTLQWVAGLEPKLRDKLARVGLVEPLQTAKLGPFIDSYISSQQVKASTKLTYTRASKHLLGFFGRDRDLRTITPGEADDWWAWMRTKREPRLAENTARKSVSIARQIMRAAKRKRLIEADPFEHLAASPIPNRSRDYFISREEAAAVLAACPDAQWRVLFALARFGGLRVPSEVLGLRWQDVNWERGRFLVHSPKTEHHEGHASRLVPIFPELQPYLLEAFEQSEPGAEYVITRYRDTAVNLRTQLQRIIKRAGLQPWPKLWQNLRSTRETELADQFPAHVVSAWIGNSVSVATKHYLQVTEDHFQKALQKALQNPVQHLHAGKRNEAQPHSVLSSQAPETQEDSASVLPGAAACAMGGEGEKWAREEPKRPTQSISKSSVKNPPLIKRCKIRCDSPDTRLQELITAWPRLTAEQRASVLVMVRASRAEVQRASGRVPHEQ